MKKIFTTILVAAFAVTSYGQTVIKVASHGGDATKSIQAAIERAAKLKGKAVVITLDGGTYNISRDSSSMVLYYISNTASEVENPDQTKHIGLWFKGLKNVTLDGKGARIVTHGEMTSFVVDGCENVTLTNFTISAADPTVPEMTVTERGDNYLVARVNPISKYKIQDGRLSFVGHKWSLSGGIAQSYDPVRDITWRSWSPFDGLVEATELSPNVIRFSYKKLPDVKVGTIFQMRDAIRDQACGLIEQSRNTLIENARFEFLGNFGIVGQMSENITYRNLAFEPDSTTGRTCAGFADFVQMSGCRGKLKIENSRFVGAHDDPINIHGTHLKVLSFPSENQALVKYMHHQSYGFKQFFEGDEIEFINENSLLSVAGAKVKSVKINSEREILLTFERALESSITENKNLVVENVTYTPQVEIVGNYFSRIPTRGILISTRRPVLIQDNTFFKMQMSGILIADDARSWFESGMVRDVTIRGNKFIECGEPVIFIAPENNVNQGYVHSNIRILDNEFRLLNSVAVKAKSVDGLKIEGNIFTTNRSVAKDKMFDIVDCRGVSTDSNQFVIGR